MNPRWYYDDECIFDRHFILGGQGSAGLRLFPECNVEGLGIDDIKKLADWLHLDTECPLPDELLADARDAIAQTNLRRAVLELAVAFEVWVKHAYFAPETLASAAFSQLEESSAVRVRPIDFVDAIALRAIGRSLRLDEPSVYRSIDYLFRCRNRVAHRGTVAFKDDAGTEHFPDHQMILEWWQAVQSTFRWFTTHAA